MIKFNTHQGLVVALDRANVDTDAIIPKQYLKSVKRSGFGKTLFDDWRYTDIGSPESNHDNRTLNKDFVLNLPRYKGASILLSRDNFGCGSSREHAVWALTDYGIKAVIATSFADIFFNNSFNNGLLPIALTADQIEQLFIECIANEGYELKIDLEKQIVITPQGNEFKFEIDEFRKYKLLNGLDDIGLTLLQSNDIKEFEDKRKKSHPWLFNNSLASKGQ